MVNKMLHGKCLVLAWAWAWEVVKMSVIIIGSDGRS